MPVALAEVQRLFLPDAHTPQHGVNAASPHVVTDQVLIKVTKTGDGDRPCSRCVIVGSAWKSTSEEAP